MFTICNNKISKPQYFLFTGIMMAENPWLVNSIEAFSFFNCPECQVKTKDKNFFQGHALQNHPLSFEFFCTSSKKPKEIVTEIEKIESLENKAKEDETLERLIFPDSNSKSANYIVTEVEEIELLKNGNEDNKTLEEIMFPDDCFGKTNEESEEVNLNNLENKTKEDKTLQQLMFTDNFCNETSKEKMRKVENNFKSNTSTQKQIPLFESESNDSFKPFKCNICDFETEKKPNLKRHIESVHEGIKLTSKENKLKCQIGKCNFKTRRQDLLDKHRVKSK